VPGEAIQTTTQKLAGHQIVETSHDHTDPQALRIGKASFKRGHDTSGN
jgi:hypothetical protein